MTKTGFIGVVCGLKSEAAAVRCALGDDPRIRIGVSGANAARAEDIAKMFCAEGARAILSVGVSGGLDPALKPGDLVIGACVKTADGFEHSSAGLSLPACISGPLYGSDTIIQSPEEKRTLFQRYAAVAVDMESHGCARAASAAGVPFLAVRAIADPADRALPPAAMGAVAPDGSTRVLKTLGAALRDPGQFPELMKLGKDSAAATKTLRRDLEPIFRALFAALDL